LSQKKGISNKILIIAVVAVIAVFGVTGAIAAYWQSQNTPVVQPTPTPVPGTPNLVSSNLLCLDNRTTPNAPFVQVTGTVTNTGNAKASNCTVNLTATRGNDVVVINTSQAIQSLAAGESVEICLTFPYTGAALTTTNAVLDWTN
jgi:hypothetical protein